MTITLRLAAALAAALLLAAPAAGQALDKIRKSGVITLGYIDGATPFSFSDEKGEPAGYSVALCRAVAEGIAKQVNRELKQRWVKLTIQNRIDAVRKKEVDVECSTTTWTLGRNGQVDFSLITFLDGGALMVGSQSEIAQLSDLGGKRVAVIGGTTTEKALREALAKRSIAATVATVSTREEGLGLLQDKKADAFASDRTALIGVVVMRPGARGHFKLLDQDFSIEQYALMLPRGDTDFRVAVNRELARVYRSGEIDKIYGRWLAPLGPPSLLLSATYFIQSISE